MLPCWHFCVERVFNIWKQQTPTSSKLQRLSAHSKRAFLFCCNPTYHEGDLCNNVSSGFLKMGQIRPILFIFVLFSHCKDKYSTNLTINDKSIDGVLGSRTQGGRMEGTDESTELWWHPKCDLFWPLPNQSCKNVKCWEQFMLHSLFSTSTILTLEITCALWWKTLFFVIIDLVGVV